jgi:hypothetical protein
MSPTAASHYAAVRGVLMTVAPRATARGITGRLSPKLTRSGAVVVDVDCSATHGNLAQDTATVMAMVRDAARAAGFDSDFGLAGQVTVRQRAATAA